MPGDTEPPDCRDIPDGRVPVGESYLTTLGVGSKLCLFSYESRWALVTIARMPAHSDDVLRVHVVVLDP